MKLEYVQCDFCKQNSTEKIYEFDKFGSIKIVRCNYCNLVYTNPRLNEEELKNHYHEYYHKLGFTLSPNNLLYALGKFQKKFTKQIPFIKNGNLLDVGSGKDSFLFQQKERGFNVYGVDIDKTNADFLIKNGITAFNDPLKNLELEDNFFDIITFWHSLEHDLTPVETLYHTNRILKNNGLLIISVPNFDSLERKIFGTNWSYNAIPRHLYHFEEKTLTHLLKKNDFKILKIKYPFFLPQLWTFSLINFLEDKLKLNISYKIKLLLSLAMFPMTLMLNAILSVFKSGSVMDIYATKESF